VFPNVHPPIAGAFQQFLGEDRHKTWDECNTDEKMERLRECLRSKDLAIQRLQQMVANMSNHQHGERGEILVPLYGWGSLEPAAGVGGRLYDYDPLA
jgi:hypothetical protein